MTKTIDVQLNAKAVAELKKGYPLILKDAVLNPQVLKEEGSIIKLVDRNWRFVAKGYYGVQNKGIGWVLTRKENEAIDFDFFKSRIAAALKRRESLFEDADTTAFRVFNGEGDGIGGLTIDYYDGYYVVSWYSEGIYSLKHHIYNVLEKIVEYKAVYEKKRFDTKGQYIEQDDFVKGEPGDFPIIVKENGMNFAVDLNDGAMTGIFLDQRDVRKAIHDKYAEGRTVLNTFSYTGAFSVAASLGGAAKTVSVDLASRSESKTIEQFSVNGIDYEQQEIRVMDVFDYFRYAKRHELKFGLVILDPPSFARSKKYTFSTARNYPELVKDAIAVTEKNGFIVASTNNASFGMKRFKTFIDRAFKETNTRYKILEESSLPRDFRSNRDFPEFNYLKVVILQKLN
ncbi:class I SAM-dependent rRNA methyltransferase [Sporosarcina pasteurii]|uniref:Ribosomal RNA large subunit methyltransferase I n=1 Tax=Sporosarcina pasteurii TaxID=1474 RepID=A0A380CHY3_SPOPA|nr:class I SAM-dependent rRNA methyltransferase [Sporosarcina pasteurii]MDS9472062.1 class I SAM-dependent rRNA methyltransferase [Sporosarcina pasteurii]QBQ06789.1 class I SAM-dependent rRNA methyltransferase [Sporosarcina pasteurii]SUJ20888.1 Ribosomal RNA large subunit methyltransferase I [Sporosarcina pasteurii]